MVALTIGFVCLAVLSAPGLGRKIPAVDRLFSSLGQTISTTKDAPPPPEVIEATPGLTLEQVDGNYEPYRRIESQEYTASAAFSAVGVRWHAALPIGTAISLDIRTGNTGNWSDWQHVNQSDDVTNANDPTERVSALMFVSSATQIQFAAELETTNPTVTPRLETLRFDLFNPEAGPSSIEAAGTASIGATSATANQPAIISRGAWGANPALMNWPPQYATVKQIFVHHTAGGNGGSDPAATIRGIYQYHSETLGWGDIGYNFIIDPQGRIYEGRYGGWSVIGAHALGYNTGSIGISMLGTYESSPDTQAAENALIQLTGFLSAKYDLDPTKTHLFIDKNIPTLAGHRDAGQTLCPGTAEYNRLPTIRTAALAARSSYYAGTYSGSIQNVTGNVLRLNTVGSATVTVKNTGSGTWTNSGSNPIVLKTKSGLSGPLSNSSWNNSAEPSVMKESAVPPGKTATFTVPLSAADYGDTSEGFVVARRGAAQVSGTLFTLTRSVRPDYQAAIVGLTDPIAVEGGTTATIEVRIKNTGAQPWSSGGVNPTALNLTEPVGRTSILRDASWPLPYRPTMLDSASVAPDQVGLFSFQLQIPPQAGEYFETMQAVVDHVTFIPGANFTLHVVASNPYQSELEDRPIVIYATPGEQKDIAVSLTNRSSRDWKSSGSGFVALELKNPKNSSLRTSSWVSPTRPVKLTQDVPKNGSVALSFPISAPGSAGEYIETYQLVSDGQTSIDGSTFSLRVVVRPALAGKLLTVNNNVSVKSGESEQLVVEIKNIGAQAWHADGPGAVTVVTDAPLKHSSGFVAGSWRNGFTPTKLESPVVAPDQTARLTIEIAGGITNGDTQEKFTLLDGTGAAIVGSAFTVTRTTTNAAGGAGGPTVRIGIYNDAQKIGVHAASAYDVKDAAGGSIGSAAKGETHVNWDGSKYIVSGAVSGSSTEPIRFVPKGQTILDLSLYEDRPAWDPSLNDNAFRGILEVRRANGKLYAVNELSLENYMRGLGEASGDTNSGYLKVLSIAARTYAEFHRRNGGKHPAEGYDLDNKNDQVYKGYNLEKRNQTWVAAVDATSGKFVTYQGAVVVTPYFSRSDGHTRGFHEVWGGPVKPWLVRVEVPENNGKTLLGHGVGLDASAAYARAAAGQSVEQVLKSFYSGTQVTKLY